MALRKHDVNILKGTDCKVIGRKFDGTFVSPFL